MRKLNRWLAALCAVAAVVLLGPASPASATQAGVQTIVNDPNSMSGFSVQFNCGTYGVNPNSTAGENFPNPPCGKNPPYGDKEPVRFLIGPNWCATRYLESTAGGGRYGTEFIHGGTGGVWVQAWQSWYTAGSYTTWVEAFPAGWSFAGYYCTPGGGVSFSGAVYEN